MFAPPDLRFGLLAPHVIKRGIPHDGQQPGACVISANAIDCPECFNKRFLNHVLGIMLVADQPSCQIVRTSQVRPNRTFKLLALILQASSLRPLPPF
jgi:hypothetical protein